MGKLLIVWGGPMGKFLTVWGGPIGKFFTVWGGLMGKLLCRENPMRSYLQCGAGQVPQPGSAPIPAPL